MVWIPTFAGMTIWKLPETQKQLKPNTLDSRLRGNDGAGRCRLKLRHSHNPSSFPRKRESRTSEFSDDF